MFQIQNSVIVTSMCSGRQRFNSGSLNNTKCRSVNKWFYLLSGNIHVFSVMTGQNVPLLCSRWQTLLRMHTDPHWRRLSQVSGCLWARSHWTWSLWSISSQRKDPKCARGNTQTGKKKKTGSFDLSERLLTNNFNWLFMFQIMIIREKVLFLRVILVLTWKVGWI